MSDLGRSAEKVDEVGHEELPGKDGAGSLMSPTVRVDGEGRIIRQEDQALREELACEDGKTDEEFLLAFYKPKVRSGNSDDTMDKIQRNRRKRKRQFSPPLPVYVYRQTSLTRLPERTYKPREIDQLTEIFTERVWAALEIGNHSLAAKLIRSVSRALHERLLDHIDDDGMRSIENKIDVADVTAVVKFLSILSALLKQRGLHLEKLKDINDLGESDAHSVGGITKTNVVKSLPVGITALTIETLLQQVIVGKLILVTPRSKKPRKNKRTMNGHNRWAWRYEKRYGGKKEESSGARGGRRIGVVIFADKGSDRHSIANSISLAHFMTNIWSSKERNPMIIDQLQRDIEQYANVYPKECELFKYEMQKVSGLRKPSKKLKAYLNRNLEFFCPLLLDVTEDCSREGKFRTRTSLHDRSYKEIKKAKIAKEAQIASALKRKF